jgi:PfaB family protein
MEKIAIIGLGCLFPDAKSPEEFWQNLIDQKDSVTKATSAEIGTDPSFFYDPTAKGVPDKTYSTAGGYIRDFQFDPNQYNLPSTWLAGLDPLFQGSLYVAKQALQDSHYLNDLKVLSRCGVILGNMSSPPTKLSSHLFTPIYRQAIVPAVRELLQSDDFQLPTVPTSFPVVADNAWIAGSPSALVAKAFSLSGINFALDAACASSLHAVKLASHYLWSGQADLMIAGAISYNDPLLMRMVFSGVQAYPEDGISRPFDKSSRGLVPADGIGMLVLKRYSDALRDGDQIYATVCGNGLSNDGKGKHLLSPNPQGQMLAFERAYAEANITPNLIKYIECHATGTLLGDATELSSTDAFFGRYQAAPLVGSVKANIGHLLPAAGTASIIKVILSMSKGVIPPTINVTEPLSSPNNVIAAEQIVRTATPWTENGSPKRAAVSAFGFGGNNAHLILEQPSQTSKGQHNLEARAEGFEPTQPAKMAIVGMDALFGSCDSLDAFERSMYEGTQQFIPLPAQRWKGIETDRQFLKDRGLEQGEAPKGAYIEDFVLDTLQCKIQPNEAEQINPQQLLILKVADRAIKDAGLAEGGNVAVITATETELAVHQPQQRWNLPWQIKQGLEEGHISLSHAQAEALETIVKDSMHPAAQIASYMGFMGLLLASRISALWNFNGPSFTLSAGENSVFKALEVAQLLLTAGEVDAVVVGAVDLAGGVENVLWRNQAATANTGVPTLGYDRKANGWMIGEGAGAVVLKRHETAKQEGDRIYATIDAISLVQQNSGSEKTATAVTEAVQQAFAKTGLQPGDVNYLEVFGSGIPEEDEAEIRGLVQAYQTATPELSCALGCVKANIGHTYAASGMASLIKTSLCLYHRYIPAVPQWSGPKSPEHWQGSPFYMAANSRPWLLSASATERRAAINGIGMDGTYAHVILSDEPSQRKRSSRYLEQMPLHLFPLSADDQTGLLEQLETLSKTLEKATSLSVAASQTFVAYQAHAQKTYSLAILGRNREEVAREIQRAFTGIIQAFETGEDWQTPAGSYFTVKPLGQQGKIAYVYPGGLNSYVGLGRTLFRLFPQIYESRSIEDFGTNFEQLFHPRSLTAFSKRQMETLEQQLIDNPLAMFLSGMSMAEVMTKILRDYFQIQPQAVFGYSLGEISTFFAQGVWARYSYGQGIEDLHSSPLFSTRLSGPKDAVREYWGMPREDKDLEDKDFWSAYVLITPVFQIIEALKQEERVYLTQIHTPTEAIIAGDTPACLRVIESLGCDAFRAPIDHAIHCEAIGSEYDELVKLNTLPTQSMAGIRFYSSAEYKPVALDSHSISHSVAKAHCQPVDFPRLVNQVYDDGARIFIETGAGSNCSRWISEVLKQKAHLTVSLNRRGVDDHVSMVKALAKLFSHQVSMDLSPLYQAPQNGQKRLSIDKTITLGGHGIRSTILSESNREIFKNLPSKSPSPISPKAYAPAPQFALAHETRSLDRENPRNHQGSAFANQSNQAAKAHSIFLEARQESLHQIAEIIQLQVNLAQQIVSEISDQNNQKP